MGKFASPDRGRPGHIRLLDIEQLQAGACECYEAAKGHYERLLTV